MDSTKITYCVRCGVLRSVEDWSETGRETLSIVLGPCGHVIERTARLEWTIPMRRADARGHGRRVRLGLATS